MQHLMVSIDGRCRHDRSFLPWPIPRSHLPAAACSLIWRRQGDERELGDARTRELTAERASSRGSAGLGPFGAGIRAACFYIAARTLLLARILAESRASWRRGCAGTRGICTGHGRKRGTGSILFSLTRSVHSTAAAQQCSGSTATTTASPLHSGGSCSSPSFSYCFHCSVSRPLPLLVVSLIQTIKRGVDGKMYTKRRWWSGGSEGTDE